MAQTTPDVSFGPVFIVVNFRQPRPFKTLTVPKYK